MNDLEKARTELSGKSLFVFDLDGTVYLGNRVFPFAIRFIRHLRASGRRVLFFTNNASRSRRTYLDRLSGMGFDPAPHEILTSGNVTEAYLNSRHPGASVYLMGTEDLREEFRESGIRLVEEAGPEADVAVASFDTELTYAKLEALCRFVRNGSLYLATHPDPNCPSDRGPLPDCGSFIALIRESTGRMPKIFGKPEAAAADAICELTNTPKDRICVFGDRLLTDVALGSHNGICSVLVETGANTREDAERLSRTDRPSFVFPSLAEVDELLFPGLSD